MRERYERYGEGDLERVLDLWTDDFVWVGDDSGLPGSGRHEGKQAAIASFRRRSVRMTSMSDRRGIL